MSESSSDQDLDVEVDVENSDQEITVSAEETELIKRALLKHPLFPLLALLFEKCELATMTCGTDPDNEKLERELMEFAQSTKEWSAGEESIDQLMLESLQASGMILLLIATKRLVGNCQQLCDFMCRSMSAARRMQCTFLMR